MSIEITMSKTAHSSGVLCLRSGFQYGNAAKIFTHPVCEHWNIPYSWTLQAVETSPCSKGRILYQQRVYHNLQKILHLFSHPGLIYKDLDYTQGSTRSLEHEFKPITYPNRSGR